MVKSNSYGVLKSEGAMASSVPTSMPLGNDDISTLCVTPCLE